MGTGLYCDISGIGSTRCRFFLQARNPIRAPRIATAATPPTVPPATAATSTELGCVGFGVGVDDDVEWERAGESLPVCVTPGLLLELETPFPGPADMPGGSMLGVDDDVVEGGVDVVEGAFELEVLEVVDGCELEDGVELEEWELGAFELVGPSEPEP